MTNQLPSFASHAASHFTSHHSPVSPVAQTTQLLPPQLTNAAVAAAHHYAAAAAYNFGNNYASQMQMVDPSNMTNNASMVMHNGLVDLGQSNCIQDIHATS
jgi:hypothetical protein